MRRRSSVVENRIKQYRIAHHPQSHHMIRHPSAPSLLRLLVDLHRTRSRLHFSYSSRFRSRHHTRWCEVVWCL